MEPDPIVERIERELGHPGLVDALAGLSPSDAASLLLTWARRRAEPIQPAILLSAYRSGRLVDPSAADPRVIHALEARAFTLLPDGYELLDLSPVAPFGTAHTLGRIPQDWIVSATHGTEVANDPTAGLALECATRRREGAARVQLATRQRVVRAQPFAPPLRQHWSLVALCSAGRDPGGHAFDTETLQEHVGFYLDLAGDAGPLRVVLTAIRGGLDEPRLADRVAAPLAERFPEVRFELDRERQGGEPGYYVRACFRIWLGTGEEEWNLADGGFTDWSARLLGDRKERLLTSGIGLERLAL
jgi:hypothetical protein